MNDHLKLHDNDVLKCSYCLWAGAQYVNFSTHMNTHFQNRTLKCSKCPMKFYTSDGVSKHLEAFHEKDTEKYSCDICNFKTYTRRGLLHHTTANHNK